MNIKTILKSKKSKNILFTILEIVIVAGLIFGVLMFIYNKINKDTESSTNRSASVIDSGNGQNSQGSGAYYIEINKAKNIAVIYEYSDKKHKKKKAVKVFPCSIGKSLKSGTYKTKKDYSWIKEDGYWHQYNTKLAHNVRIWSPKYSDKYSYSLNKKSYNHIGKKISGKSIEMYSIDAAWIFTNCKSSTTLKVIKGKKSKDLPFQPAERIKLDKHCLWDPTDPSGNNPYAKIKQGKIVSGNKVVYVEKGHKVHYFGNILALDESGKSIVSQMNYKKFSSDKPGKHTVKYSFTSSSGIKYELTQEYRVVDTTCPVVSCSRSLFTYQVISQAKEDMNKDSNVKAIEAMVRQYVSCNEPDCTITVKTITAGEMAIGSHPVIITAKDPSGNIGSCQVMVDVKLYENKVNNAGLSDAKKEALKKAAKQGMKEETEKVTTKKKEKPTKKKKTDKKKEETTKENSAEENQE